MFPDMIYTLCMMKLLAWLILPVLAIANPVPALLVILLGLAGGLIARAATRHPHR
jgi:hypothetical protein